MPKEPITIRIEPEVWKEARKRAIDYKISAGALVETAILKFLRSYSEYEIKRRKNVSGKMKQEATSPSKSD